MNSTCPCFEKTSGHCWQPCRAPTTPVDWRTGLMYGMIVPLCFIVIGIILRWCEARKPTSSIASTTTPAAAAATAPARPPPAGLPPAGLPAGRLMGECSICLTDLGGMPTRALACAHVFHGNCIAQWIRRNRSCPVCRTRVADEVRMRRDVESDAERAARRDAEEEARNAQADEDDSSWSSGGGDADVLVDEDSETSSLSPVNFRRLPRVFRRGAV
jgi:hypothetical protein